MSEDTANGRVPFQDSRSNSSQAYLKRAASAVAEGDSILGIHLYLAAYERALRENLLPSEEVLEGMSRAWDLAIATKQRSLAEYIFEKLEPHWSSDEVAKHADELQRLAFDKLEEYGFDRDVIEDMADMVNQDLMDAAPDMLCHFEESPAPAPAAPKPAEEPKAAASAETSAAENEEAKQPAAESPQEQAVKNLTSLIFGQAPDAKAEPAVPEQRFDYRSLVGFDGAIGVMGELGIGRSRDPEFARFVAMLNKRHGLPGIPGVGTLVFRSPAREDANYFMVATAGELALPAIRMRLDQNAQGQAVLCVMASSDFKSRISGVPRAGFETPTVVILEDLDLWDMPTFDSPQTAENPVQNLLQMQLSRGAREALALIQVALESPEATVLISASEPNDIDPFFWELIGPQHRIIDVELPDVEERRAIWREIQSQHPSTRGLDVTRMVELSRSLSRFEIMAIASEAVEDAYRESIAKNRFCAVSTGALVARLANFQPLDSEEYRRMEDLAVEELRRSTSDFDDLLED